MRTIGGGGAGGVLTAWSVDFLYPPLPHHFAALAAIDGREVMYGGAAVENLSLAYAATVHKSQGSEYDAVVIGLHTSHFVLLNRALLYTAITRAAARGDRREPEGAAPRGGHGARGRAPRGAARAAARRAHDRRGASAAVAGSVEAGAGSADVGAGSVEVGAGSA